MNLITTLIFDWGDTIMRDFPEKQGPMYSWDHVEWIPGVEEALKKLQHKFILVIATNAGQSDTQAMKAALSRVGADRYFQHFFSSKDLGFEKPDVRFFSSITEQLGTTPGNCAMIGNLYEKDIIGAKQCGMLTVFYNEKNLKGDFYMADAIIASMNELPPILGV